MKIRSRVAIAITSLQMTMTAHVASAVQQVAAGARPHNIAGASYIVATVQSVLHVECSLLCDSVYCIIVTGFSSSLNIRITDSNCKTSTRPPEWIVYWLSCS